MTDREGLLVQYDNPPAAGDRRFWMSVTTWAEDWDNEAAAWAKVRRMFPDGIERFINPADDKTLVSIGRGGRFRHPSPETAPEQEADMQDVGTPAP